MGSNDQVNVVNARKASEVAQLQIYYRVLLPDTYQRLGNAFPVSISILPRRSLLSGALRQLLLDSSAMKCAMKHLNCLMWILSVANALFVA